MANQPKNDAKPVRHLWIAANLLLTIAVCLLLVVIKSRLDESHKESSPVTSAEEDQTPKTVARDSTSRQPVSSRLTPNFPRTAKAGQPVVVESVDVTAVDSSSSHSETVLLQTPGGAIAPLAATPRTNLTTAIAGRVTLRGEPPPEQPIDMSGSPCAKLQTNSPTTRNFVVSPDGGLADVFVSILSGLDRERHPTPNARQQIVFVNCQIQPYMSAVVAGQELLFRNADSQSHRVQLVTTNNSRFTHDLAAKSEMTSPALMKPESFLPIKCEKHPWELAYVFVVEHPFFAVSDTNGNFVIPNVPPGRYTLRASHLFAGGTNTIARGVKVIGGQISQVNFTFDAPTH